MHPIFHRVVSQYHPYVFLVIMLKIEHLEDTASEHELLKLTL